LSNEGGFKNNVFKGMAILSIQRCTNGQHSISGFPK